MNDLESVSTPFQSKEIESRVESLLSSMSLAQKIGQLVQTERMAISPEELRENHIGSVLSGGGSVPGNNRLQDWIEMNDAYWEASTQSNNGNLPIPLLYGVDAIHGHNNVQGATIFPHNIGLGAMRDPKLIQRIAHVTAKEILASGVEWTFAPTLAVARDIRWGRTYESYSQNTDLVKSYAAPFVKGLQGKFDDDSVIACVKHWVGDGGTTYGMDQGETSLSEEELRKVHVAPYLPALDAGTLTLMVSFNSWMGEKCHGHKYLVNDVLKDELGFQGFVISDWDGINYLSHDFEECIERGMNAGIDMFMVSDDWRGFLSGMHQLIGEGRVSIERLDDAVRRILRVKFIYGLFEKPRPKERKWSGSKTFGSKEHREVAREAVRKSLVLLKNEKDILPLDKNSRVLVAGKSADDTGHLCGGFTIAWQGVSDSLKSSKTNPEGEKPSGYHSPWAMVEQGAVDGATSIWEGIEKVCPKAVLNLNGNLADPAKHDVAIVVIGETPYAEGMGDIREDDAIIGEMGQIIKGEMKILSAYGRSVKLSELHPEDLALIKRISDKGIPVVTIYVGGRPLVANEEIDHSDAFIAAWLPGSEGDGVADVLFGDYDFNGKLSFDWPERYVSPNDRDIKFPFGYGLNYRTKE